MWFIAQATQSSGLLTACVNQRIKTLTGSDQHSAQLSSLPSVLWWAFRLQDTVLHRWDRAGAGSIHSVQIWCGSTSQKANNTTKSNPSQKNMSWLFSLWNFLEQSRCPRIYQHSADLPPLVAQMFRWGAPQVAKDSPHMAFNSSLANFLCFQQDSTAALFTTLLVSSVTSYSNPGFWSTA